MSGSNSEEAFAKALAAEKKGDTATAERWLKLAAKKDAEERGLSVA